MIIEEIFMGFYETTSTTAEALFNIVKNILAQFDLNITLYKHIKEIEPRALYVHCNAHNLNLVVQDGMECISSVKNFIGVIKELINFIRDSPKRQGCFKEFQSNTSPMLAQFCPTRCCVRVKSLKTLYELSNYEAARLFFESNSTFDCSSYAKTLGFLKHLESFNFYFYLSFMIRIFEVIEALNTNLQKTNLNIQEAHVKEMENVAIGKNKYEDSGIENALAEYKNLILRSLHSTAYDFDIEKLTLHRRIFFDVVDSRKLTVTSLGDVITILQKDKSMRDLVSEYTKLIKILLTIPVTTCTAELSFSALRRLKTYLRSSILQVRLNSIAVLHEHSDIAETLDIDALMDEFIVRNKNRSSTFALNDSRS
ncbi:hypothetical protein ALC57_11201 [Trachymyrmex cornetzi]|uniref:HAT C-terminal dimerisation domain-containing protein n=1 Tax=Trachymyrmex cornetzi TaxID=471704 RepID=A0A151J2V5_9HYME|nr:hypothetical protein ALC57_11201 [Trachymyrmex cornetzi]